MRRVITTGKQGTNKKIPMRICVGCREMKEKREMIRVIRTPENTFCIDMSGKKNGRGAYLCKNEECLTAAVNNHGLDRSFKMKIPEETVAKLKEEMEQIVE